jgi:hypothetical protein
MINVEKEFFKVNDLRKTIRWRGFNPDGSILVNQMQSSEIKK